MNYQELKQEIAAMEGVHAKDYREMFTLSSVAGGVLAQMRNHLEEASSADEFFEAVYNDDELRFENVWAMWAKLKRKPWVQRFEADIVRDNLLLDNRGVFLRGGDNEILIPMRGRGRSGAVYVFAENGFNERAAELFCSIYGDHSCCGIELKGAYDVYRTDRALIFERWDIDKLMRRANGKGQISSACSCNAVW